MKKLLYIVLCLYLAIPLTAQENKGIQFFNGSWNEALQLAQKENKLIFVDCYSTWCGPCSQMTKKIFPQQEVGDFYNEHFICVKTNVEKEEDGIKIKERYNVVAYPTFLFITAEGYVAHRGSGFQEADKLIALGKKALEIGHNGYEERFTKGEREESFLKAYVKAAVNSHQADLTENILNQLYKENGKKILRDKDYWKAFEVCAADVDAPLSLAFLKDYKKLCKVYGNFSVDQKIRNLYASIGKTLSLYENGRERKKRIDEGKKKAYFALMEERKIPNGRILQQEIEFILLLKEGQYEQAYALGKEALTKADARILCNWATLGERLARGNQEIRTRMAEWAKRALELGLETSMQEEAKNVLHDLTVSPNPAFMEKGSARKSIPMRGYAFE